MFTHVKDTLYMLEGAYKKIKTYYYYDKTLLHIKRKIVDFEATKDILEQLKYIAERIVQGDTVYFDELIERISFVVLPKSFKSSVDNGMVHGNIDKTKEISRVNFAIDMPMELYIIDFLWTLLISKIVKDKDLISKCSYAAKMKRGVIGAGSDLYNAIDFSSNRCFEPYFDCYKRWRNCALNIAQTVSKTQDVIIISLDLKNFYYNANFDFGEFESILSDKRYEEFTFLTDIVRKIYDKYTSCVMKLKKGINKEQNKYIFPIGLISPLVLRDIVMRKIDDSICDVLQPQYYGRYVDDMLLVVNGDGQDGKNVEHYLNDMFVVSQILQKHEEKREYCFVQNNRLKVQLEKVNCIYLEKGTNNVFLDVYLEKIRKNSSEANMLPDIDLLNESFQNEAYVLKSSDNTSKIRNIKFVASDNYNATLFINGLKQLLMDASFEKASIERYLDDILAFYDGSQAIEFSDSWRSIFELLVLCNDKKRANEFYFKVKRNINELTFNSLDKTELYEKKKVRLLKQIRATLIDKLDMAISLALALDYRGGKIRKHIDMAKKIRIANMLNHNMVSIPLLNYTFNEYTLEKPLINFEYKNLFSNINERTNNLMLDKSMLRWSPRFIHLHELYLSYFYFNIGVSETFAHDQYDEIFSKYIEINHLSSKISKPFEMQPAQNIILADIRTKTIHIVDADKDSQRLIGLVNTKIDEKEVLNNLLSPQSGILLKRKQELYKLLNEAREQNVKYLIFPEFYMPWIWLRDICKFAKQAKISIITGLQYVTCNDQAFNVVCALQNSVSSHGFKNVIPLFREKNNYAPDELIDLAQVHYWAKNPQNAVYYVVNDGEILYSSILCYEFTDIASRYILKGKTDFICVPQLNKDTNYFSSIVESAARDLHTIIVQANTSKYGDSRITGPFKTERKDIIKMKGGKNEVLIVGEVNWKELQDFKKEYYKKLNRSIAICYSCKKKVKNCDKCKKNYLNNKDYIKGLPPNWKK